MLTDVTAMPEGAGLSELELLLSFVERSMRLSLALHVPDVTATTRVSEWCAGRYRGSEEEPFATKDDLWIFERCISQPAEPNPAWRLKEKMSPATGTST